MIFPIESYSTLTLIILLNECYMAVKSPYSLFFKVKIPMSFYYFSFFSKYILFACYSRVLP